MENKLTIKKILKDVWVMKKSIYIYNFLLTTFNILKILLATYILKYIFDVIVIDNNYRKSLIVILAYGIIILLIEVINKYFINYKLEISNIDFKDKINIKYCSKIENIPFEYFENSDFKDVSNRVISTIADKYISTISIFFAIYGNILLIIGLTSLIVALGYWIVFFVAFSVIISTLITLKISKNSFNRYIQTTNKNRFLSYIKSLFYNRTFIAENRVFDNTDFFKEKYNDTAIERLDIIKKSRIKLFFLEATKSLIEVLLIVMVFAYLVISYFNKKVGVGDIASLVNASQQLNAALISLISILPKLKEIGMYVNDTNVFLSYVNTDEVSKTKVKEINSIEFKNVKFKYPQANSLSINDVSFRIEKGMNISIVGENGAGKSTLIKLLIGLYEQYEGEILINNISLKKCDLKAYTHLFGVVFQDYNIYPLTIKENIDFGKNYNEEEINQKLKKVQLLDKINSLDNKINTVVSKEFDKNGTILSGGEMQKIAIIRSIINNNNVIVVDEAFSHIDTKSELLIYKMLREEAKNKILISISHRLATTINSDLIIVLNNGVIHEIGTHDTLMKNQSIYYEMFNTQKNQYLWWEKMLKLSKYTKIINSDINEFDESTFTNLVDEVIIRKRYEL